MARLSATTGEGRMRHQLVVERNDHSPVRVLRAMRGGVNRCDRGLDVILGQLGTGGREIEQSLSFGDEMCIPSRTILIEERAQVARRVNARRQTRRVQAHQRGKRVRRRRRGERMLAEQRRRDAWPPGRARRAPPTRGRAVVALVEEQIERAMDGRKARGEIVGIRDVEQPLRSREHFLRARDALLDRRVAADERAGDFAHAEAAQDVEHERDLRLLGQPRMAAGEHHAQLIVFDRVSSKELFDRRGERPFALEQPPQFRRERARRALAPQNVERAVLRRGHEPRGRVLRHAAEFPHFQRAAEGVLHDVFRQREVVDSEDARQRGDHAPRFAPEKMIRSAPSHVSSS